MECVTHATKTADVTSLNIRFRDQIGRPRTIFSGHGWKEVQPYDVMRQSFDSLSEEIAIQYLLLCWGTKEGMDDDWDIFMHIEGIRNRRREMGRTISGPLTSEEWMLIINKIEDMHNVSL